MTVHTRKHKYRKDDGPVGAAPTVNVFNRPLQKKYIPSATGCRPEAEFWKNLPSKHV